MDLLSLQNAHLQMRVDPQGGSVQSLFSLAHWQPVLREPAEGHALFPMLPLANRVAGNRFSLHGRQIVLPQSPVDTHFYLHGDGWLKRWQVVSHMAHGCELQLRSQHPCGFDYLAHLRYELVEYELQAELHLTHCGQLRMLYGLGFHPWFYFDERGQVQFSASGYWPEGEQHLPLDWQDRLPAHVDFSRGQYGRDEWLNVCYSGWNGLARIQRGVMAITLLASTPWLMLFRMQGQPFICLEPQSHPVNAHCIPGQPGLVVLQHGETTNFRMSIQVNPESRAG